MATNTNDNGNDRNPMVSHSWYLSVYDIFCSVYNFSNERYK